MQSQQADLGLVHFLLSPVLLKYLALDGCVWLFINLMSLKDSVFVAET